MAILNAIGTILAFVTFLGIVFWAFSRGRKKDNDQAAMLPFALPDEGETESKIQNESSAGSEPGDESGNGVTKKDEEAHK